MDFAQIELILKGFNSPENQIKGLEYLEKCMDYPKFVESLIDFIVLNNENEPKFPLRKISFLFCYFLICFVFNNMLFSLIFSRMLLECCAIL